MVYDANLNIIFEKDKSMGKKSSIFNNVFFVYAHKAISRFFDGSVTKPLKTKQQFSKYDIMLAYLKQKAYICDDL